MVKLDSDEYDNVENIEKKDRDVAVITCKCWAVSDLIIGLGHRGVSAPSLSIATFRHYFQTIFCPKLSSK